MRPPPDNADSHLRRAREEYRAGDLEGAAAEFRRALEAGDPAVQGAAAFGLGLARIQLGDRRAAFAAWRQAIATEDPEYATRAAFFIAVWLMGDPP